MEELLTWYCDDDDVKKDDAVGNDDKDDDANGNDNSDSDSDEDSKESD